MVKIYLDTCCIQRPLDRLDQTRTRLEAEALLGVIAQINAGVVDLISSTVLELEVLRTPLAIRREHGEQLLARATEIVVVEAQVEQRASRFVELGIQAMDAFHLAAAEFAGADYFCTCDERFLRRARSIPELGTIVMSPLELIEVIEK